MSSSDLSLGGNGGIEKRGGNGWIWKNSPPARLFYIHTPRFHDYVGTQECVALEAGEAAVAAGA